MLRFYHETFALSPKLWCRHISFYFLLGEGANYQHQHVCAPSLITTILPSYFKKILATNNIVLTLFYPAYFIPHNTRGRGEGRSAPKLFLLLADMKVLVKIFDLRPISPTYISGFIKYDKIAGLQVEFYGTLLLYFEC